MKYGAWTALIAASTVVGANGQGHRNHSGQAPELVLTPRMHELLSMAVLPSQLDWRSQGGQNYAGEARNQHIPLYCGSCYSFAATSSLSDRIRIAREDQGREINLAMQVVLNCNMLTNGCDGGMPVDVYRFIHNEGGIPDETCQPYEAIGHDIGSKCTAETICKKCNELGCVPAESYPVYDVQQYGLVSGEFRMMAELQRGPIACEIATPPLFETLKGWEIFEDFTHDTDPDHDISVVGYGTEDGKDYWIIRNSWGTYWGHYGWARVARGKNNIMIESDCAWAVPSDGGKPKWRHLKQQESIVEKATKVLSWMEGFATGSELKEAANDLTPACRSEQIDWAAVGGERVTSPLPQDELKPRDLPARWDWRNVSGQSFVTWNTNEHLPKGGCASCWAHGLTSALSDRIAIKQHGQWPRISLSPQMLINCNGGGGCSGGDPAGGYAYIHKNGITDHTCQNYQAEELPCDSANVCRNCAPGGEHGLSWPGVCVAVRHPMLYFVSEYGSVRGAFPMKAEIYKRGPIGCGLDATARFRSYQGGIYSESRGSVTLNQQVSVAGWGSAGTGEALPSGTEFWVGRNSWGTYWGEEGWFRIQMYENNLGVETDCDWGVPHDGPLIVPDEFSEMVETTSLPRPLAVMLRFMGTFTFVGLAGVTSAATLLLANSVRRFRRQGSATEYLLIDE